MVARAAAALVVLSLVLAGCGGRGDNRSKAVGTYIDQVNLIAAKLQAPFTTATNAGQALAAKGVDPAAAAPKLRAAAKRIDALRVKLAAIEAPLEAKLLRMLLLRLTGEEAALTREVAALAAFLPTYSETLQPLDGARKQLAKTIGAKRPAAKQADALDAYSAALEEVLDGLRQLRPPPVAASEYRTQTATLVRVRAAADALSQALRKQRAAAIPKLVHEFEVASLSNQTLVAQRARIASIRAYNARVRGLGTLLRRVDRERARLQQELG